MSEDFLKEIKSWLDGQGEWRSVEIRFISEGIHVKLRQLNNGVEKSEGVITWDEALQSNDVIALQVGKSIGVMEKGMHL